MTFLSVDCTEIFSFYYCLYFRFDECEIFSTRYYLVSTKKYPFFWIGIMSTGKWGDFLSLNIDYLFFRSLRVKIKQLCWKKNKSFFLLSTLSFMFLLKNASGNDLFTCRHMSYCINCQKEKHENICLFRFLFLS